MKKKKREKKLQSVTALLPNSTYCPTSVRGGRGRGSKTFVVCGGGGIREFGDETLNTPHIRMHHTCISQNVAFNTYPEELGFVNSKRNLASNSLTVATAKEVEEERVQWSVERKEARE